MYKPERPGGPITEAPCWAHARRKLFELADIASKARGKTSAVISPIAFAAVQKFDAVFAAERSINGLSPAERLAARRKDVAPLVENLIEWMTRERAKLSRHNDVAKAMDYMLKRVDVFTRFLDDGRICISNNAAERALRGIALGRKAWLFAGSDRGGARAAVMFTLIQTCRLNDVDPQAWLADVLARIADHHAIHRLDELLAWNWKRMPARLAAWNAPEKIALIRITPEQIEPEIWRLVEVPLGMSLKGLHDVIQAIMGWQDYHLFEFRIGEKLYGIPAPEWEDSGHRVLQARTVKLETLVAKGADRFEYTYDFGDNWEHTIAIERVIDGDPAVKYPRFVAGERRGPPEDVGSVPGYYEFLEAATNKSHREHKRMLTWYGGPYDPDDIDLLTLRLRLDDIAKRRHAGKAAYVKSRLKARSPPRSSRKVTTYPAWVRLSGPGTGRATSTMSDSSVARSK